MKIFLAGPEASSLKNIENIDYQFENLLESYFYVKKNINKKYEEVLEFNKLSKK